MNPLLSLSDYEQFIYTLQQYSLINRSTLVVIRRGLLAATVQGELELMQGFRLVVREHLTFAQSPGAIRSYGYEVWQGEQLHYWYDSQPHPHIEELANTDPHHKHIHPDIKHNRIPAPGLSFDQPNFPFLLEEIEQDYLTKQQDQV
jgi:hypothetical protein